MPINVLEINKRSEALFRIEDKLNLITKQLGDLDLASISKQLRELADIQNSNRKVNLHTEGQLQNDISQLISAVEQRFENQFLQFESLLSIYNSLPYLRLLPATRGWAGSPDFLAKIIELILKMKPRFVLEASSGVSTVVIGLALKLNNQGKAISLDHEELYAKITTENIEFNNISDVSNVIHCPLKEYKTFDKSWTWYEIANLNLPEKIDLLIIDGPPGKTQYLARYPAVPLLHQCFADRTLIVLDDANRNDEIIVVQKWITFLENNNFRVSVSEFKNFEKGMVILEVSRPVFNNFRFYDVLPNAEQD